MENVLRYIYLGIAALLALLIVVELLRAKSARRAINLAIVLVPVLLRALSIK